MNLYSNAILAAANLRQQLTVLMVAKSIDLYRKQAYRKQNALLRVPKKSINSSFISTYDSLVMSIVTLTSYIPRRWTMPLYYYTFS